MTRRGYTFVEVLLVLAVLAVLAGIATPAVLRFTSEQSIKDAAEAVRRELDATRFRAIDQGVVYEFRYEPGGAKYLALPGEPAPAATTGGTAAAVPAFPTMSRSLPEGMIFQPAPEQPITPERIPAERLNGLPDAHVMDQANWSPPIVYHPDGTGSNATFRVADDRGRFVELSIRELTGMASAGPMRQGAEL